MKPASMKRPNRLILAAVALAAALAGQSTLTNEDVIKLSKGGLSDDFIIDLVNQRPGQLAVDARRLVELKENQVTERVIRAMVDKAKPGEPLTGFAFLELLRAGFSQQFLLHLVDAQPAQIAMDADRILEFRRAGASEELLSKLAARGRPAREIPAGAEVAIRLIDGIDSEKNQPGDSFQASLAESLIVDGKTVAPRGADVTVKLVEEKEAGTFTGRTELTVALASIRIEGKPVVLNTTSVSQESGSQGAKTAKTAATTGAIGAVIGAIAGGGRGAAIGAGAGAAAGAGAQVFMKGQRVRIPSETLLYFTLRDPVALQ
jgi:hypothetical protein